MEDVQKHEMPENVITQSGYCTYCGQLMQINTLLEWTDDVKNACATENCDCRESRAAAQRKKQRERAHERVDEILNSLSENTAFVETAHNAVELVSLCGAETVSFTTGNYGLKISRNSKDKIKIDLTEKHKKSYEE